MNIFNSHALAFACSAQLLTRIPVFWASQSYSAEIKSLSTQYYAFVGLLLGGCLWGLAFGLGFFTQSASLVQAVVIICFWVFLTGALHLDGFMDCLDASYAGHCIIQVGNEAQNTAAQSSVANKNTARILNVMKEPTVGAMSVVAVILLLIAKIVLVTEIVRFKVLLILIIALVLPRLFAVLYMRTTRYVRDRGMAAGLELKPFDISLILQTLIFFLFSWLCVSGVFALVVFSGLFLLLLYWRSKWLKKIDGFTGDCVGAYIEMAETLVLFITVLFFL